MRKKVTVVGGGFVGSTTAQRIHDAGLADVVCKLRLCVRGHGRTRAWPVATGSFLTWRMVR